MKKFNDGRDWFFEKRYGMFIHWGLYAINAFHEQEQWRNSIPREEYMKLADKWNPVDYDPNKWIDLARESGMEYLVLTTKHHDGFCLWDTKETEFNTINTPYGKDLLKEFVDACHKQNFPVGLYYSVVDWNHKNYPNAGRHHELNGPEPGDKPDIIKYTEYLKRQVNELCTNYGDIKAFWWDMNVEEHQDPSINEMIRTLQPNCIINDRGMSEGDYSTPEREWDKEKESRSYSSPVEACNSVGTQSWGYREGESYYSSLHLLRSIDNHLAKGGNYLLNVGPDAMGVIPHKSAQILSSISDWLEPLKEAFYDTEPYSDITDNQDVLITKKKNVLYIHLNNHPSGEDIILKPLEKLPVEAILLNNQQPLKFSNSRLPSQHRRKSGFLHIKGIPVNDYNHTILIIKLVFEENEEL